MAMTRNPDVREVLNLIVNDSRYEDVMRVPLISISELGLVVLALGTFGTSTWAYFMGYIPMWAAMILNMVGVYFAFTPLHDSSHRAVSRNHFINDWAGMLAGQLLLPGVNMTAFRAVHMDHHRYTGQEGPDPDTKFVDLPKFLGYAYLMFADVNWVIWYFTYARKVWPKRLGYYVYFMLLVAISVHVAFLMSPYWKEFLLLYVVPQRLGLGLVAYCFAHIQHPTGLTWENEAFQSTNILAGNSPLRRLMFGQEDHAIHHLLPHVPWYNYKRVWELANGVLREQNIPECTFFTKPKEIIFPSKDADAPFDVKVAKVSEVADGVKTFMLTPAPGATLPGFSAGSHISLHLPSGLIRQYSLVNEPGGEDIYQIAIKLEDNGRGGSKEAHEILREGATVKVSRPHNNFMLYESAKHYLLISGGIGLTPLLSMSKRLKKVRKHFELHVCARDQRSIPFAEELTCSDLLKNVTIHLDSLPGVSTIDLDRVLKSPSDSTQLYLCGPEGFMKWVKERAVKLGWNKANVRTESFSAPIAKNVEDHAFTLELSKSGRSITVTAEQSVIDALQHSGLNVDYACLQGTCGTCITRVVDGVVDHRDAFLSEAEKAKNSEMCLCVSRAKGDRLVLDL